MSFIFHGSKWRVFGFFDCWSESEDFGAFLTIFFKWIMKTFVAVRANRRKYCSLLTALSIEVFVSLLTVNVQISIIWPLAFYLQRAERWRRAQNVFEIYNKNRAEFPQAGAWIDFGPCGRWSDSQHRHCSVCTVNMTSLLRYGAVAAKWNTHPHLCGDLIRLYRLCLCTFSTNRTVLSGGELRSVSAKG